jgi:hypothetical protein
MSGEIIEVGSASLPLLATTSSEILGGSLTQIVLILDVVSIEHRPRPPPADRHDHALTHPARAVVPGGASPEVVDLSPTDNPGPGGIRRVGWLEEELREWIAKREVAWRG